MKRFYNKAILALRPNAQFVQRGSTYSGLEWLDTTSKKPTEQEIENKIQEIKAAEPMRVLRIERNRRLAETDWTQSRDVILENDAEWKTYRQALRDLPKMIEPDDSTEPLPAPTINEQNQLIFLHWPEAPA